MDATVPQKTPETVPAAVRVAAERFGDACAVLDGATRLSYAQLHDRVRATARTLIDDGIAPGDAVAVWAPNTHHWITAALGALYAGAVLVPINTRFTAPEAADVLGRAGVRALFVEPDFLGRDRLAELRALDAAPELVYPIGTTLDGKADAETRAYAVGPDDVCDVLFTSGTTGRSKGAMSAHRQSIGVARAWAEIGGLTSADRYLVVNPFFHSFGYKAGILACLLTGATLVPQAVFDVEQTIELIASQRISVLPGAPTIYQSIIDHPARAGADLSSLRLAVTGAAVVPQILVERMSSVLGFDTVLTAYGLTECVVATMCRPGDDAHTVAMTSGRAAAQCSVRVADNGEILLRGPNVMLGYLDDPAATAESIVDGWLHTGDVGRLDGRGYLTITDRLKDMFICGGFNVYPAEIEQVLARLDGVAEAAVIGVPDSRLGEVGKAFLRTTAPLRTDEVLAYCKENLANYKVPREIEFRDDLPRNPSGKILKRLLREHP